MTGLQQFHGLVLLDRRGLEFVQSAKQPSASRAFLSKSTLPLCLQVNMWEHNIVMAIPSCMFSSHAKVQGRLIEKAVAKVSSNLRKAPR